MAFATGAIMLRSMTGFAQTTNTTLSVMTYNLRYASATPPNAWPQRRPLMSELITKVSPDLIGTQEGLLSQLQDLASDLPDYNWVGVGRDDGNTKGEFMAVFYRKARLEALSTNYFWLSDTPEVPGSSTWGNTCRRMVTRLKFRDRVTGEEFYFFDTHFDNEVQLARENSAKLLRERVSDLKTKLPVLLVGDFNAAAGTNSAYSILTDNKFFTDLWLTSEVRRGDGIGTFNGFQSGVRPGPRIDWIFARGEVEVKDAETLTFSRDGQFPSDHFPVVARINLPVQH